MRIRNFRTHETLRAARPGRESGGHDMKRTIYKVIDTALLITIGTAIDAVIMGTLYMILF